MRMRPAVVLAVVLTACAVAAAKGPAARRTTLPVVNGGFEQAADAATVPGWIIAQHAGVQAYEMRIDPATAAEGKASFRVRRLGNQVYGSVTQVVAAPVSAGKTLELSARIKTADVGPGGWMLFIDGAGQRESKNAVGTGDWHLVKVRLKLPAAVRDVTIGALLLDRGTAWLDDVRLQVVD